MAFKKRTIITVLACLCAAALTSGCSLFTRQRGYNDKEYTVTVVKKEDKIPDNSFFVKKEDGTYHRTYVGETTFRMNNMPYSADPERVCWFGKDYNRIPTMHKGEVIVYRSSSEFTPQFYIERYEDLGYTLGISGLTPAKDGRYMFSTSPSDKKIDIDTSANVIYQLGSHTATIEKIGGVQLRSGNVSSAGTIIGLEQGRNYKLDLYVGTEVMQYTLVADVRAFSSMELFRITDYDYTGGKIITIRFPDALESGYYLINGFGMVKYIDSSLEFDERMDMNVPNKALTLKDPSEGQGNGLLQGSETEDGNAPDSETTDGETVTVTDRFRLDNSCRARIILAWEDSESGNMYPAPSAKVIGEYGVYTLNDNDEGMLTGTYDLPEGDYKLEITGLFDRKYSFQVLDMSEKGY